MRKNNFSRTQIIEEEIIVRRRSVVAEKGSPRHSNQNGRKRMNDRHRKNSRNLPSLKSIWNIQISL